MVNTALKRILLDIVDLHKEPIENAHIHYDESNLYEIDLLLIGPEKSPYYDGFYMFKLIFNDRYPQEPPKVKFLNSFEKVRFHPNLYENGKVCLSILGTWSGPGWTSVMSIRSLIMSLLSLLDETPLRNEPGYESETIDSHKNINYNKVVQYYNWYYSIIYILNNLKNYNLKNHIYSYYLEKYNIYQIRLDELKSLQEVEFIKCMYAMKVTIDYKILVLPNPEMLVTS
jgi:ubiquitin-protein ligase